MPTFKQPYQQLLGFDEYIIKTTRLSLTLLKVLGQQENVVTVKSHYQIMTTTKA